MRRYTNSKPNTYTRHISYPPPSATLGHRGWSYHKSSRLFCQCFTREANASCAVTTKANAIGYAKHRSRSHRAVIRVYDEAGNVIDMHEHAGKVQGVVSALLPTVLMDSVY